MAQAEKSTRSEHARVTPAMARVIVAAMRGGATMEDVATALNITPRRVRSIVAGRTWGTVTGVQKKER